MIDRSFSSAEVAHVALVTLRQLQWWDESGILSPERDSQGRRIYRPRELFGALLYHELNERGFTLAAFRRVWKEIERQGVFPPGVGNARYLLTNGERVVFLEHSDVALAFLAQRRSPLFALIPIEPILAKMAGAALGLPERKGPERAMAAGCEQPCQAKFA